MSKKKKRLLLVPIRHPKGHSFLEEMYSKILPARGWEVSWYFPELEPDAKPIETKFNDSTILSYPKVERNDLSRSPLVWKHPLKRLLESGGFDLLQIRNGWRTTRMCLPLCKKLGIPLVFQKSFPIEDYRHAEIVLNGGLSLPHRLLKNTIKKRYVFGIIRQSDWIFTISEMMKKDLARYGFAPDKMTPMPMGFNCDITPEDIDRRDLRQELGGGDAIALYFGSMVPLRRLDVLLEAFVDVRKNCRKARLVMLGGGDDPDNREKLRHLSSELGLGDSVVFHHQVSREEVFQFIRASDFTLSPIPNTDYYRVSSPTKVIESLALGRPAIASDLPDQAAIIRESGAGIVTKFDRHGLAAAMTDLFLAPEKCAEMGQLGRSFVEKERDYNRMADTIEEVYSRLIK